MADELSEPGDHCPAAPLSGLPERYELKGELGRGGMGVVYRALDRVKGRDVAIKAIPSGQGGSLLRRFRREAEELARLQHPNIVAFYGVEQAEDRDLLVMEFVDGGNLFDAIVSGRKPVSEWVNLFIPICEGLQNIHSLGLVHRDLKPENILLTRQGVPKITDFGLARRLEGRSKLTTDGTIVGSYSYLAPEQVITSEVGPSADLYALGAVMFEAFTGRPPFVADTEYQLLQAHVGLAPPSPKALRPDLPAALEQLIMSLLKKRPQDRPGSAQEVRERLRACLDPHQPLAAGSEDELLGRGQEARRLEESLSLCQSGGSPACLLTATSGLGRTRLLQEVCNRLATRGLRLVRVSPENDSLLRVLGEASAALGANPEQFFKTLALAGTAAGAEALRRALGANPGTLLVADDVDRLSPTCQAVLRHLASLVPSPGSGWLLSCAVSSAEVQLSPQTLVVELSPLSYDAVETLACRQLAELEESLRLAALEPRLALWLAERAEGSPRQLKLLLLSLLRSRTIAVQEGVWVAQPAFPENTDQCLLQEVARLDEQLLRLLRPAALLQEPFSFELLQQLSGVAEEECEAGLNRLVALGLLEESCTSHRDLFLFSSQPVRHSLAQAHTERARKRLHARAAQLVSCKAAQGMHLLEAHESAEALPLLVEMAERSQARGACLEAYALWQLVLPWVHPETAGPLHQRVQLGSAQALAGSGQTLEAIALLDGLLEVVQQDTCQLLFTYRRLAELRGEAGKSPQELRALCLQGLAQAGLSLEPTLTPPRDRDPAFNREAARIYRLISELWLGEGDGQKAADYLRTAGVAAALPGDPAVEAELALLEGRIHLDSGVYANAEQRLKRSQSLGQGPVHQARCWHELGRVYMGVAASGEELPGGPLDCLDGAEGCLDLALDLWEQLADTLGQARVLDTRAQLRSMQGGSTVDSLQRAVDLYRARGAQRELVEHLCLLGQAYAAETMDEVQAEDCLQEALEVSLQCPTPGLGAAPATGLGWLFRQRLLIEQSVHWFSQAVAYNEAPPEVQALARIGLALVLPVESPEAYRRAEEAVALSQQLSCFHLGLACWCLARCQEARQDRETAHITLRLVKKLLVGIPPHDLRTRTAEARQAAEEKLREARVEVAEESGAVLRGHKLSRPRARAQGPLAGLRARGTSPLGLAVLFVGLALTARFAPPYAYGLFSDPEGNLLLNLKQDGATIQLDSREIRLMPWAHSYGARLEPGFHNLTVSAPNRGPVSFKVEVTRDHRLTREVSLPRAVGTLIVRSNRPGAEVFVDGRGQGTLVRSQLKLDRLAPGPCLVEVRAEGFWPRSQKVTVQAGQVQNLELNLTPRH